MGANTAKKKDIFESAGQGGIASKRKDGGREVQYGLIKYGENRTPAPTQLGFVILVISATSHSHGDQ